MSLSNSKSLLFITVSSQQIICWTRDRDDFSIQSGLLGKLGSACYIHFYLNGRKKRFVSRSKGSEITVKVEGSTLGRTSVLWYTIS